MKLNLKDYTCQSFIIIIETDYDDEEKISDSHIFIPYDDGEEILNYSLCDKFYLLDDIDGDILPWKEMDINHIKPTCKDCLEVIKVNKLEVSK